MKDTLFLRRVEKTIVLVASSGGWAHRGGLGFS
jgi:hypothetical protein